MIRPHTLSTPLLSIPWQYVLVLPSPAPLPLETQSLLSNHWSLVSGIPGRLVTGFEERNKHLLYPKEGEVPKLVGSVNDAGVREGQKERSMQRLEFESDVGEWAERFKERVVKFGQGGRKAVSMLNLLAFKEGEKETYMKYGKAFGEGIGARRGGVAKLVGNVLDYSDKPASGKLEWEEIALAHYPTIDHFLNMAGSEDYQSVNHRYRLPSLKDTFIICTTDIELGEDGLPLNEGVKAKL